MVQQYAAGITIDVSAIEDAVQHLDPTDPESMNQMFSGSMFIPEPEGAQKAAIDHLETLLALIEGWVDVVVTEAAKPLDSANALREMINRRRASGGPAEHAFGSLVGLDLRPRRLHDATKLWMTIQEAEELNTATPFGNPSCACQPTKTWTILKDISHDRPLPMSSPPRSMTISRSYSKAASTTTRTPRTSRAHPGKFCPCHGPGQN